MRWTRHLIYIGFALLYSLTAQANTTTQQSHAQIRQVAKVYLTQHVNLFKGEQAEIVVGKLDSRLRLPKCSVKLKAYLPTSSQRQLSTVAVGCDGSKRWHIYIPVKIKIYAQVAVSTRNLARGHVLDPQDLRLVKQDRSRLHHGYYTNIKPLVGLVASRSIRAGAVITQRNVKVPPVVQRGETVIITARSGSVHVEMQGIARKNGILGKKIPVYNKSSKRTVEAIVVGPGRVMVPL